MKNPGNILDSHKISKVLGWFVIPLILLIVWEIAARQYDQVWLFPPVSQVLEQLAHPLRQHYASGSLLSNTWISFLRVITGFLLAALIGVSLGLLMGSVKIFCHLTEPLVEILRPLCPIAWLPFAIVVFKLQTLPQLFGFGYTRTVLDQLQVGMIFVIFVGGFFPILTNTIDGVSGVRQNYLLLAKMLGAGTIRRFWHVYLPAALPNIMTGLRQGLGLCWFVIIAAEMMTGSDSGIGYLLMYAADNAAMDIVIASMLIIGAGGAALNFLMLRLMKRFVGWHGREM